jgi:hypothetical protein
MSSWSESVWYLLFLSAALKGTALLVAAWMAATLLRRQSAAARHLVWTATFAVLLALPLLSLSLPALRMPVAPPTVIMQTTALMPALTTPAAKLGQGTAARPVPASSRHIDWRLTISLLWAAGAAAGLAHMLLGL